MCLNEELTMADLESGLQRGVFLTQTVLLDVAPRNADRPISTILRIITIVW